MDPTVALERTAGAGAGTCPRCGADWSALPTLSLGQLDGLQACRCTECGTRATVDEVDGGRWIYACNGCGVPFRRSDWLAVDSQRCPECDEHSPPPQINARWLDAVEGEIVATASHTLAVWDDPALNGYLARIAQTVAQAMGTTPAGRIDVLDLDVWRVVSLPSGRIWITRGFLEAMEDEAQLAFVLGHEMAHTASGDAAARFIRLGLVPLVREGAADRNMEEALSDLSRLGFGPRRERQADEAAVRGVLASGYATRSIGHLLERAAAGYARGDSAPAEWIFAHPPIRDRFMRLEIAEHVGSRPRRTPKINREVFRRIVRGAFEHDRARRPMTDDAAPGPAGAAPAARRRDSRWIAWTIGVAGLTAAILWIATLLAR